MRQHRRSHMDFIMTTLSVAVGLFLFSGCASRSTTLPPPTPFTPIPVDFAHTWAKGTHPFTGAAVIDVEGDGTFEVFVGGGEG